MDLNGSHIWPGAANNWWMSKLQNVPYHNLECHTYIITNLCTHSFTLHLSMCTRACLPPLRAASYWHRCYNSRQIGCRTATRCCIRPGDTCRQPSRQVRRAQGSNPLQRLSASAVVGLRLGESQVALAASTFSSGLRRRPRWGFSDQPPRSLLFAFTPCISQRWTW